MTSIAELKTRALQLRIDSIRATTEAGSGHPTSCLSLSDVISTVFFRFLKADKHSPENPNNDRFILSKGHTVPVLYAAYKQYGVISDADLLSLRKFDSVFEGHPTPRWKYNEAATGSLGQGLGVGVGQALHARRNKLTYRTFVALGDGEIAEGSVWEAAEIAGHLKLGNLTAVVDANRLGQTGASMHEHHIESHAAKFTAFGWNALVIDGHDIEALVKAFETAQNTTDKPTAIIAKTFKGHGVDVADKLNYHGKPFTKAETPKYIDQLKDNYKAEAAALADLKEYTPPAVTSAKPHACQELKIDLATDEKAAEFAKGKLIAPRKAFGYAIASLGKASETVWAVDADVGNSTFLGLFQPGAPDRFVQCYIAEQNMVSVATGLSLRGNVVFAGTFGCFLTRAADQLRMAGIGRNALRLCGSHIGVSIGQDGPSQMGLEDISLFRSIPHSIVLYPSDGVSTYKLVEKMANYHNGVSYIRTTRGDLPNLYDVSESFTVGGSKVLKEDKEDKILIVAAGITLHEALAAHDVLKGQGISTSLVDLYSVKPLDSATVLKVGKASGGKVLVVEDHYIQGGLYESVVSELVNSGLHFHSLHVSEVPRSASPEELLKWAKIDSTAIVDKVKSLV